MPTGFAMGLALGRLVDDLVGTVDGVAQYDRLAHQSAVRVDVVALFTIGAGQGELGNRLHGDTAGDFASVVASHAVGQHHEPDVGIGADRILIVLANPTGVGDLG